MNVDDAYIGEIRLFAGAYAPYLWTLCEGQLLSTTDNEALFSLLGTMYGGDGRSSYGLPDFRGRLPVGQGTGPGLTPRSQGQQLGAEAVTLDMSQMPAHSHQLNVSDNTATVAQPDVNQVIAKGFHYLPSTATGSAGMMNPDVITDYQGDEAHTNLMPFIAINFILCLQGNYPQRN